MFESAQVLLRPYETIEVKKEYPGLNSAKGILVFMVVITHCLPDSLPSYFMYLFHMPLFLGIGGFLLKHQAFSRGFRAYSWRMLFRLVIPWVIATIVYLPLHLQNRNLLHIRLTDFLYPFYHLWYIPAYGLCTFVCYLINRYNLPIGTMLGLTGFITLVWYIYYRENPLPPSELPLYWIGDKRLYAYIFFFVTGFALRNGRLNLWPKPWLLLGLCSVSLALIFWFVLQRTPDYFAAVPYVVFNFCLLVFTLQHVAKLHFFQHRLWLTLNRQSLGVYLYHPLLVFGIYEWLGDPEKKQISKGEGLAVGLLVAALVLGVIWLLKQWKLTNKFMLGNR